MTEVEALETKVILLLDTHLDKMTWELDNKAKALKAPEFKSERDKAMYDIGVVSGMKQLFKNLKDMNLNYLNRNGENNGDA